MKKLLIVLVALVAITGMAMANGGSSTGAMPEGNKLVVWSFTNELEDPIAFFENLTGAEVEFIIVPSEDYLTKIRPVLRSGTDAPDVFTGEAAFVKELVNSGFWMPLEQFNPDLSQIAPYVVDIGTDPNGDVVALSWQTTPGGVFYRRSIAKEVFGTDAPNAIGDLYGSWDDFLDTAEELKAAGYYAVPGYADTQWFALNGREAGWVIDGALDIAPEMIEYIEIAKTIFDNGYSADISQWSPAWFEAMGKDSDVFSFMLPTWGLHYVLKDSQAAPGDDDYDASLSSWGDWGLTSGPAPYFWGGTWLGVYSGTKVPDLAYSFVEMMTLNADFMTYWAEETGDFLSNVDVVDSIVNDFSESFLAGQNHYKYFQSQASIVNGNTLTEYDQDINSFFGNRLADYLNGATTYDEMIELFKQDVQDAYPELEV
jgi:maltose-binding protein MalE